MAHHKPVTKTSWTLALKKELERQQSQWKSLLDQSQQLFATQLNPLAQQLTEDSEILEIGCGIACTARHFDQGKKTFVDPLIDDFKRLFPGELPEGKLIHNMAENMTQANQSYDLILCINTLDNVFNPELVLHEMHRMIKPNGTIIIAIDVVPDLLARLHYGMVRAFPNFPRECIYRYAYLGMINTLLRHFEIIEHKKISSSWFKSTWLFTCKLNA
ncbi:MAG: class I SAM-dependent methyltransferase [Zetaproteobacteria bacterium]|nr:class I SAM-dependent methyltransferase [Zetaproteobacteria bacterium]